MLVLISDIYDHLPAEKAALSKTPKITEDFTPRIKALWLFAVTILTKNPPLRVAVSDTSIPKASTRYPVLLVVMGKGMPIVKMLFHPLCSKVSIHEN